VSPSSSRSRSPSSAKDVYPVAEALDARGIPLIFATGYGTRDLPAAYRARPTLSRPFQRADLVRLLDVAWATRQR
jgi:hypothetical protein